MISEEKLSSRGAKDMIAVLWNNNDLRDKDTVLIAEEKGLILKEDPEFLNNIVKNVIENNPKQVEEFKSGKDNLIMYLVGQVMKEGKGAINPAKAQEKLREMLQ